MTRTSPDAATTRRDLLIVAIASALLFSFFLGARDLWNPNEPSYGRVVVEMVESGDWLLPTLNGDVFAEKPILSYWLGAVSSSVAGGVSAASLRAPLALSAVGCTVLVYLLVAGFFGRRAAILGSAVFATEYLVWWTARTVQMDSFVMLSTLATTWALTKLLDGHWTPRKAWLIAGLSAGVGFAAKGPVTSVVPAAILLAYCLFTRRMPWRLFSGLHWGLAVFALTGLPWYAALLATGRTEELHELLLRQNFSRFVEAWDHKQPWYYFLKYFWVSYAPWSWFVPVAAFLRPRDDERLKGWLLGWAWILAPLLFFSLADSKREPYMLPVAPGIALLVAFVMSRLVEGELGPATRRACRMIVGFFGLLFLAAGIYLIASPPAELPPAISLRGLQWTLLACGAAAFGGLLWKARPAAAPWGLVAALVLLYGFASAHLLPAGNEIKSHRVFARQVEEALPANARLVSYFGPGTRKWQRGGGYAFYLARTIEHQDSEAELLGAWADVRPICLITEEPLHDLALPELARAERLLETAVGSKTSLLICRTDGSGP